MDVTGQGLEISRFYVKEKLLCEQGMGLVDGKMRKENVKFDLSVALKRWRTGPHQICVLDKK